MDDNALVQLVCANCGRTHPDSSAHIKAHWDHAFSCEGGCGSAMWLDRQELIVAIEAGEKAPLIIKMHKEKCS